MIIYKYTADVNGSTAKVIMPAGARIIRMDYVDDGYYLGNFVWAIVDPNEINIEQEITWDTNIYKLNIGYSSSFIIHTTQLGVLENQEIYLPKEHIIFGVKDVAGKLMLYYRDLSCNDPQDSYSKVNIAIYKTGQEFKQDSNNLEYLGFCRIFILQELGMYIFKVN